MSRRKCIACGTTQPSGWSEKDCFHCGKDVAPPEYPLELKDYTPQQKQDIYDQYKKEREQSAQEKLAAKNAEHPRTADGELDMADARNNPLLRTEKEYDPDDITDPKNNPLLPDSTAPKDFGNEKEVDYSRAEHNPLIPK